MGKILLLIVLAAIAVAWFRARARRVDRQDAGHSPAGAGPRPVAAERMVTCAYCALNLPASEAVFDATGTAYCGAPHLEAQRARERR